MTTKKEIELEMKTKDELNNDRDRYCYKKGKAEERERISKEFGDWVFETMKNFSGIDKDFFKDDCNNFKSKIAGEKESK